MNTMNRLSLMLAAALLTVACSDARAGVLTGSANAVLGQQVFTSSIAVNVTCNETMLSQPYAVAIDTTNDRLFISDSNNHRVLWWNNASSLASNAAATGVLGQASFTAKAMNRNNTLTAGQDRFNRPRGIALDGAGRLWVADENNSRILRFDLAVSTCNADLVLGQAGVGTNAAATTQTGLNKPLGVTVDTSGNIWVADSQNNRVLRYNASSLGTGAAADIVLGTTTFTYAVMGSSSALGLNLPQSVKVDPAGNVYVAEYANNRVVMFAAPISSGMAASVVLGQSGFDMKTPAVTQSGIEEPYDVCVDTGGNVWVAMYRATSYNARIVRYPAPLSTGMNADVVLGQANFSDTGYNRAPGQASPPPVADGLFKPSGVTVDLAGRIWIADTYNNRVVRYDRSVAPDTAQFVLGQPDLTHRESTRSSADSVNTPYALAIDTTTNRLFAADYTNHRVLWWNNANAFSSGAAADGVLGQRYFGGNTINAGGAVSSDTLRNPAGVAVDPAGNIWVADRGNNRVLRFAGAGLASGTPANLVLGQTDFITASSGTATTTNLAAPTAVRIDRDGYIWVADADHHRVVRYAKRYGEALANNEPVDVVLGQTDATGGTVNQGQGAACRWGLYDPTDINFDTANTAWVVDRGNNRVLKFSSATIAATAMGAWADGTLGQTDYTSTGASAALDGLNQPRSVGFTPGGNILISDAGNARLLIYGVVSSSGAAAIRAVGQAGVVAQNTLYQPRGTVYDMNGNLLAADAYFNRILRFSAPTIDSIAPAQASVCDGTLTTVLSGHDFGDAMNARMERSGFAAIAASTVTGTSDTQLTITFPLSSAATGYWDVVVSTLGYAARFANAVEISTLAIAGAAPAQVSLADTAFVTVTATGTSFRTGMVVRLERTGQAVITASSVTIADAEHFSAVFSLTGAPTGYWDLTASTNSCTARYVNALYVTTETVTGPIELDNTTNNTVIYSVGAASVTLNIPADTFADTFTMSCTVSSLSAGLDQSGIAATPVALEITNSRGQQPRHGITITIAYTDAAMTGVDERTLVICYYDAARERWIQIASTPDPVNNTVTGVITHLTAFRIFARVPATGLDDVTAYPNPYKPSAAGYGNSVLGAGVVFGNITENARIRIYTIAGDLVRDESINGSNGTWIWDTRTDGGDRAASGVYVYFVTNPDNSTQKATGKIAIIR